MVLQLEPLHGVKFSDAVRVELQRKQQKTRNASLMRHAQQEASSRCGSHSHQCEPQKAADGGTKGAVKAWRLHLDFKGCFEQLGTWVEIHQSLHWAYTRAMPGGMTWLEPLQSPPPLLKQYWVELQTWGSSLWELEHDMQRTERKRTYVEKIFKWFIFKKI